MIARHGYSENDLHPKTRSPRYFPTAPTMCLPYLSDNFCIGVQRIFMKHGLKVNVMAKPPPSLKQILVKSRLYDNKCTDENCLICSGVSGQCKIKGAVYKLTCTSCSAVYVGETGRELSDRIREHRSDIRSSMTSSRRGPVHAREDHAGEQITFSLRILAIERRLQERNFKEAIWIKMLSPSINIRAEMTEAMQFISCM